MGESILQPSAHHIGVKGLWDHQNQLECNSNYCIYMHLFLKKRLELTNAAVADSSPRGKAAKFCQDSLFFRRLPHACRHSDKTSPPWARLATMIPFSWAHQKRLSLQADKELWEPTWPRNRLGQIMPRAIKPCRRRLQSCSVASECKSHGFSCKAMGQNVHPIECCNSWHHLLKQQITAASTMPPPRTVRAIISSGETEAPGTRWSLRPEVTVT